MNIVRLEKHQFPSPPQHDLRKYNVLDSSGRYFGEVAHLYVDEDVRKLHFVDVLTLGFFALGRKHYLVPVEAIADESASRGQIKLNVEEATLKRSPRFPNPLAGPDAELQHAIHEYYGYAAPE
jgi:hypothetical protein